MKKQQSKIEILQKIRDYLWDNLETRKKNLDWYKNLEEDEKYAISLMYHEIEDLLLLRKITLSN